MGICEDIITEDSTEFEKAFLKIYDGSLWKTIEKMKDWQPPKPLVKIPQFLEEMKKVAFESYRVLRKDKFCAILMGDTRIKGCVQPMSFEVMKIFETQGFKLKEIIIKEQHNCKATGYWKTNSVKYNFLLLAHEYLFVFRKE